MMDTMTMTMVRMVAVGRGMTRMLTTMLFTMMVTMARVMVVTRKPQCFWQRVR